MSYQTVPSRPRDDLHTAITTIHHQLGELLTRTTAIEQHLATFNADTIKAVAEAVAQQAHHIGVEDGTIQAALPPIPPQIQAACDHPTGMHEVTAVVDGVAVTRQIQAPADANTTWREIYCTVRGDR